MSRPGSNATIRPVFACGLLNSQPMGFYAPAQIVRDARDHGVTVLPVDVNHSNFDCTIEQMPEIRNQKSEKNPHPSSANGWRTAEDNRMALRLGFREIKGFAEGDAEALTTARTALGGFDDVYAIWLESGLEPAVLERLANADAYSSIGLTRRQALWAVRGLKDRPLPLFAAAEIREQRAEIRSQKSGIRNQKPETRNQIPDSTSSLTSDFCHQTPESNPAYESSIEYGDETECGPPADSARRGSDQ